MQYQINNQSPIAEFDDDIFNTTKKKNKNTIYDTSTNNDDHRLMAPLSMQNNNKNKRYLQTYQNKSELTQITPSSLSLTSSNNNRSLQQGVGIYDINQKLPEDDFIEKYAGVVHGMDKFIDDICNGTDEISTHENEQVRASGMLTRFFRGAYKFGQTLTELSLKTHETKNAQRTTTRRTHQYTREDDDDDDSSTKPYQPKSSSIIITEYDSEEEEEVNQRRK
jgi:hypothetical protein